MTLKNATAITKPFKQGGNTYIPAVSDDWTFDIETMYNYGDKPIISSDKLGYSITLSMNISEFFRTWIFSGDIRLEKNKLIGEFAFNKATIFSKDTFNEAVQIIEDNALIEPITNDELIDYGLYLDSTGKKYTYIGNREIISYNIANNLFDNPIMNINERPRKRYILTEDNIWKNSAIIKTTKKEFVEFLGNSNLENINNTKKRLLSYSTLICSQKTYNVVDEIDLETDYLSESGFIHYDSKYYVFTKEYKRVDYRSGGYEFKLQEINFDKFKKHLSDKDLNLSSFYIGDIKTYNENEIKIIQREEDFKNFKIYAYYE